MSMNEISPRAVLERTFRLWPVITLVVVMGGVIGWLVGLWFPPVYESHAEVFIKLDGNLWAQENHPENLADIAIFNAVRPIHDLFYLSTTIDALVAAAQMDGILLDENQIQTMFTIQRTDLTLFMTVRSNDPEMAARLANLWVQAALPLFETAHKHAMATFGLSLQRDGLAACFDKVELSIGNTCAGTSYGSLTDIVLALDTLDTQISTEQASSLSLDPAMTIELGSPAIVPVEPARYQRTWLALAGTLIGVVLGFIITQIPFRIRKGKVRVE